MHPRPRKVSNSKHTFILFVWRGQLRAKVKGAVHEYTCPLRSSAGWALSLAPREFAELLGALPIPVMTGDRLVAVAALATAIALGYTGWAGVEDWMCLSLCTCKSQPLGPQPVEDSAEDRPPAVTEGTADGFVSLTAAGEGGCTVHTHTGRLATGIILQPLNHCLQCMRNG